MKIAVASDHAGFAYKERLRELLHQVGNEVQDYGAYSEESSDYPDFAILAARAVARGEADCGILICGSGIGMSIVANKVPGVRAANCCTEEMARLSRQHNNANVLTFGARLLPFEQAWRMVQVFLETSFEGGRHERRVGKIHKLTER
ncbi:MAG: ribose 5-phosphate isomerase B [Candidatus Kapabacteria bacterium]|nr:ribose 5-phosphate isomerase B [Candidatus Kapabacteria bacterium]MDW7996495.1 ribose 5-phosphate isomerase B [Bacteroidota bacterium]